MLADVGVIGALGAGGALTSTSTGFAIIPIVGGAAYFAGGPLVHLAHSDRRGAGNSLMLRLLSYSWGGPR
jgi:hypothetical protein